MRPKWVDFHCHVDLYPDHASLVSECDREKVATLAVTTTPKAWKRNREVAIGSEHVRVALGLHPQLIAERADELALFEKLLPDARYVGEIGLDAGPKFYGSFSEQERIFKRILDLCQEQGGKVLTIHSVRSAAKVLGHIEETGLPDNCTAVLHWFTGTQAEARRAASLGCYFSVNSEMLSSQKHARMVAKLPLDRLLTETDGPFVSIEGRPARPRDVSIAVAELGKLFNVSAKEMAEIVASNLKEMLLAHPSTH